jgi:DNA-directed RNA polymerase specialized sigma24 family protein
LRPGVAIYRVALPQIYGYVLSRCGSVAVAEDLTAETFMAAVAATKQGRVQEVTVAWLVEWLATSSSIIGVRSLGSSAAWPPSSRS